MTSIIELNVGGVHYTTTFETLTTRFPHCRLARFAHLTAATPVDDDVGGYTRATPSGHDVSGVSRDSRGRWFIDRDGFLFRFVLDYVRTGILTLPDGFPEHRRLCVEADHFELVELEVELRRQIVAHQLPASSSTLNGASPTISADCNRISFSLSDADPQPTRRRVHGSAGHITVGYRGTFYCGGRADGQSDVRFRKVSRILIGGRVALCRAVFGDALNESRNPEHTQYSARFYLKHTFVEQAFDTLLAAGFHLVAACGTGTNGGSTLMTSHVVGPRVVTELKPTRTTSLSSDTEESRWNHYNEFVFCRF